MPDASITVVSVNYAGGKEQAVDLGNGYNRLDSLAQYLLDLQSVGGQIVVGLQELTGHYGALVNVPVRLSELTGSPRRFFFVPTLSSSHYPIARKWSKSWDTGSPLSLEEGMGTFVIGSDIGLADPEVLRFKQDAPVFFGRVLDLPIFQFDIVGGPGWISDWIPSPDGGNTLDSHQVHFRPSYYKGDRDTDPRIATAHRIWLCGEAWDPELPQFVLVNVHLATLREEWSGMTRLVPTDKLERSVRRSTPNARYLRWAQLGVIQQFVQWVYDDLGLPVVVLGDFNCRSSDAEARGFIESLGLTSCLSQETCYRCGSSLVEEVRPIVRLFSSPECRLVLDGDPEVVRGITGDPVGSISTNEVCPNPRCRAPLFSHKTNFQLVDNIYFTSPNMSQRLGLQWSLRSTSPFAAGLDLSTYFSDHVPIWTKLHLSRPNLE